MTPRSGSITNNLSVLAAIIGLIVVICIPGGYFIIAYQYMGGGINAEIELSARAVEGIVANNPDSWQFEEIRLQEILQRRIDHDSRETRVIRDLQGQVAAQITEPVIKPVLTRSQPIYDSGIEVGSIEIRRSIFPIVIRTVIIAVFSLILGVMIFLILYIFPLQAVKTAYHTVEENEQRLKLAVASGHFGVCDWDTANNVMVWDNRMYEIYGVSRDSVKVVFEAWQNGFHPEDRDRVLEDVRAGFLRETDYNTGFRIIQPDGTVKHIRADGIMMKGKDGRLSRMIGLYDDVTSRKETEEEREKLILELREALNNVKTLTGLLPICSSCKKVRNDKGYWEQIEEYIQDHSGAEFTHGICPECGERLYPEYYKK
jgi:PAS domain S-box-containing protein